MTAPIEVLAIRALEKEGTVRAFVDLRVGGVTIKGAKIVQQPEKRPWLAMPSIKLDHGWSNVVEVSKPLRERMTEVVLATWATRQPETPQERDPGRAGQSVGHSGASRSATARAASAAVLDAVPRDQGRGEWSAE